MISKISTFFKTAITLMRTIKIKINCKLLSIEETNTYILNNSISIIRFGDGEFNILAGKNVHYQNYDNKIKLFFEKILQDVENNNSNYLLCLPKEFLEMKWFKIIKNKAYFVSWPFSRLYFKQNIAKTNCVYGNAFIFSKYNKNFKPWEKENIKNIIFVHNSENIYNNFKSKYPNKVLNFIKVKSKNAFADFDNLMNIISKQLKTKHDTIVLISAGPTAKCLVYELSKLDIWAIDTGHYFEDVTYGL